jgi:hypothetical protein
MRRVPGLAGLAVLAAACSTYTLDAGRSNRPDACAPVDAVLPGCTPPGLLDSLIGHWRLDDGTGSTIAFDSSGRGNEGALHDLDGSSAWVAGRSQGALAIAHTGWVQVAPSPSIDAIADYVTVSAWIYLEGTISVADDWATALSRQVGTTPQQHYHLSLDGDARPSLFFITASGFAVINAPNAAPRGVWTHLAGVYDGAVARLYVNGAEMASQALTGSFDSDTTPVILGGNANDATGVPNELVPGRIDELMLYARALSATEIGQLAAGALFPAAIRDAATD